MGLWPSDTDPVDLAGPVLTGLRRPRRRAWKQVWQGIRIEIRIQCAEPGAVGQRGRIVSHVCKTVERLRRALKARERIFTDKPAQGGVIISSSQKIQARSRIERLSRVAELVLGADAR